MFLSLAFQELFLPPYFYVTAGVISLFLFRSLWGLEVPLETAINTGVRNKRITLLGGTLILGV